MNPLIALVGWTLAVLATVTMVPQLHHLLRGGVADGVNLLSASLATLTMWAWCVYTIRERDWPAFGSSVGTFAVWAAVTVHLARRRPHGRTALLLLGTALALSCAGTAAVVVASVGSLIWIVPQGVSVLRSGHLDGISVSSYLLVIAENVGWVLYALLVGRHAYAVAPIVQIPMAVIICVRARHTQRTRPGAAHELVAVLQAP